MNKTRISTKTESIEKNQTEILELKTNGKIYKYVEIKQQSIEQPVGQRRNQKMP